MHAGKSARAGTELIAASPNPGAAHNPEERSVLLPAASQQRPQQVAPDQGSMGNGTDSSSSGSDGAVPGRRPGANAPGQLTPETNGSVIEQLVRAYDERVEQAR